jgi:hypothetical protein
MSADGYAMDLLRWMNTWGFHDSIAMENTEKQSEEIKQ